jgi:hypothetical protein
MRSNRKRRSRRWSLSFFCLKRGEGCLACRDGFIRPFFLHCKPVQSLSTSVKIVCISNGLPPLSLSPFKPLAGIARHVQQLVPTIPLTWSRS